MIRLIKNLTEIAIVLCITGMTHNAVAVNRKGLADNKTVSSSHVNNYYDAVKSGHTGITHRMRETPYYAIKTNMIHDITTSMNLGMEFRMDRNITLDIPFTYNPWTYNKEENSKFKFLLFQPELRYWKCESFNGHFFGIHGHYAYYNIGHLHTPPFTESMNSYRFEGQLAGAGISYGYHWLLTSRLSIEAEIGAGYAHLWYDKFPCQTCAKLLTHESKNYWGITRAGFSLVYLF